MNEMDVWIYELNAYAAYEDFMGKLKFGKNELIEQTTFIKVLDKALINGSEFDEIVGKDTLLYRARKIEKFADLPPVIGDSDEEYLSGFDEYESKEPPIQISAEGRCNPFGVNYLYLAENEYTACAEVKPELGDPISLATFRIMEGLKIINFANDKRLSSLGEFGIGLKISVGQLFSRIMMQYHIPATKEEYLVTQYVSDYIRKAGYDGLAYRSSQTNGVCYVIFKSHKKFIKFENSKLVYTQMKKYSFIQCINKSNYVDNFNEDENDEIINKKIDDIKRTRKQLNKKNAAQGKV